MAKNINSQFDFFKEVHLDDDGNLVTSESETVSTNSSEIKDNTESTKDALMFVAQQLEDVKNLLKLILS